MLSNPKAEAFSVQDFQESKAVAAKVSVPVKLADIEENLALARRLASDILSAVAPSFPQTAEGKADRPRGVVERLDDLSRESRYLLEILGDLAGYFEVRHAMNLSAHKELKN